MADGVEGVVTGKTGPKVGKVPLIVIIGAPAALYIGYRWYKSKHGATSIVNGVATSGVAPTDNTGMSAGVDSQGLMTVGAGGIGPGVASGVGYQPAGIGLTLDAWGQAAENYLIGTGVAPLDAISAVNSYEAGQPLAPEADDLINKALADLGAPPGALSGVFASAPTSGVGSGGGTVAGPTETTPTPVSSGTVKKSVPVIDGATPTYQGGAAAYIPGIGGTGAVLAGGSAAPSGVPAGAYNVQQVTNPAGTGTFYRYQDPNTGLVEYTDTVPV